MNKYQKNFGGINTGTLYVIFIMLVVGYLAFQLVGAQIPSGGPGDTSGQQIIVDNPPPDPEGGKKNLQLYTFFGHTPVPTPTSAPTPPAANSCAHSSINQEDTMIIGFDPGYDKSVGSGGDIRAWYTDELPPMVSLGEVVNSSTGKVTKRGDTSIKDTCSTGSSLDISFEPSLYLGDKIFYPDIIKGDYYPSNSCTFTSGTRGASGPPIDDYKNFQAGTPGLKQYPGGRKDMHTIEYIWHVDSLGLSKGNHQAKIIGHDGDREIGILCANINIQ